MNKKVVKIIAVVVFIGLIIWGAVYLYLQSIKSQTDVELQIDGVNTPDNSSVSADKPQWFQKMEDWVKGGMVTIGTHVNIKNNSPAAIALESFKLNITDSANKLLAKTPDNFIPPVPPLEQGETQSIPVKLNVLFSPASLNLVSNLLLGNKSNINYSVQYNVKGFPVTLKKTISV